VCGLAGAHSTEVEPDTPHPVVTVMAEQKDIEKMGGTMRLGNYNCAIEPNTRAYEAYGTDKIVERHRHRFEVNNKYRDQLAAEGLVFSGKNPERDLVEMVELPGHPWFVACQFHPEFCSRPYRAHPLFREFIRAAKERMQKKIHSSAEVAAAAF